MFYKEFLIIYTILNKILLYSYFFFFCFQQRHNPFNNVPLDLDFDPTNGGSVPELKNPPGTGFIPYYQLYEKHGVASLLGIYLSSSMFDLI